MQSAYFSWFVESFELIKFNLCRTFEKQQSNSMFKHRYPKQITSWPTRSPKRWHSVSWSHNSRIFSIFLLLLSSSWPMVFVSCEVLKPESFLPEPHLKWNFCMLFFSFIYLFILHWKVPLFLSRPKWTM